MRRAPLAPRTHFFVCQNQRPESSPLGPGCGQAGVDVFSLLKRAVAQAGAYNDVWITQTACMGVCPTHGATVSIYGGASSDASTTDASMADASAADVSAAGLGPPTPAGVQPRILTEVEPSDVAGLYAAATAAQAASTLEPAAVPPESPGAVDAERGQLDRMLEEMEELQRLKVVALARRLKPGLTAEDIRNPHDFPELQDTDWHYEDGMLTGIQSVLAAVRATRRQM